LLCIEDPLQPGNDVGKSSYGALQVKQAFDYAYGQLTRSVRSSSGCSGGGTALSRIVQVDAATIQYRAWIQQSFPVLEEDLDQAPTPPLAGNRTLPPLLDLEDGASESSSGSPGSCRSSSPEPSDRRNSSAERGSSPECEGRNSPQPPTSPTSAMSISPASSEVGTRVGSTSTSITSSSPPSSNGRGNGWQMAQPRYKARYAWKAVASKEHSQHHPQPRQCPRADLDHNWRASASGPPSDRSSNSGSEAGDRTGQWRSDPPAGEKKPTKLAAEGERGRSDRDTNWREHASSNNGQPPSNVKSAAESEHVTSLPPSGCKKSEKNRVNGQRSADKGAGKALIKTALKAIENEAKAAKNGHNMAEANKNAENGGSQKAPHDNDRLRPAGNNKEKSRSEVEGRRKVETSKDIEVIKVVKAKPEEQTKAEQVASRVKPTPEKEPKDNNNKVDSTTYQLVECENGAVKRKQKKKKKKSERPSCMSSTKVVESTTSAGNELKSKSEKNDSNAKSNSSCKPNAGNRFSCSAGPRRPKR